MASLNLALLLLVVLGLAYLRAPVLLWTILIGAMLILLSIAGKLSVLFLVLCWLIYLAAVIFANISSLRIRIFTAPLIQKLQKNMPPMSDTEREAIEAGHVWWE